MRDACAHVLATWPEAYEPADAGGEGDASDAGEQAHRQQVEEADETFQHNRPAASAADEARRAARPDEHMALTERQGLQPSTGDGYNKTVGDRVRQLVHAHADRDYDPHVDVKPQAGPTLCIRTIEEGAEGSPLEIACVDATGGECLRTMPSATLRAARERYAPLMREDATANGLAAAVAALAAAHLWAGGGRTRGPCTARRARCA